jgi:hypothetical protein
MPVRRNGVLDMHQSNGSHLARLGQATHLRHAPLIQHSPIVYRTIHKLSAHRVTTQLSSCSYFNGRNEVMHPWRARAPPGIRIRQILRACER